MKWRAVVMVLVVVTAVMGGGAFLLERALRPCELLDIQLGRSGCIRVIELPEGFVGDTLHVANVADQVAVAGALDNAAQVLILNTQTWEVINQLLWSEVEVTDAPESAQLPVHFEWGTTRLLRGVPPRIGFLSARIPDNGVYALVDEITSQVTFFDGATDAQITTITLPGRKALGRVALSHDGSRFLIPVVDRGLTVWDVASGSLLYSVASERLWDWDWLTDNQTIVAILRDGKRATLALFRVP